MKTLNFIETLTPEQFKAQTSSAKIEVKQNPHTGKLFFVAGNTGGKVSLKGVPERPVISLVHETLDRLPNSEEKQYIGRTVTVNGEKVSDPRANGFFFMLHNEGDGGAPTVATF